MTNKPAKRAPGKPGESRRLPGGNPGRAMRRAGDATDPLGSYTGPPHGGGEPEQDPDDL